MSISGLVLHVLPECVHSVSSEITGFPGVEVHAETDDGKLVVTIDCEKDSEATDTFVKFRDIDGVLSTSLIYNYFEQDSDEEE